MRDAGVDQKVWMRAVGHADRDVHDHYTHVLEEAHLEPYNPTTAQDTIRSRRASRRDPANRHRRTMPGAKWPWAGRGNRGR